MKNWLIKNYLPLWAKETVLRDNRQLQLENERLQQKIQEMGCYIRGIHMGLRGRKGRDV